MTRNLTEPTHFDEYSENYDAALNEGISATGEVKDYFARRRVEWLARSLQSLSEQPKSVMDYGCGDGSTTPLFSELLKAEYVTGVDTSLKSLELAQRTYGDVWTRFLPIADYQPRAELDLVYCNGVFHHIPTLEREAALNYIWGALRPGGLFALWENNPWNPGTRYVMSRIPFDRDAITLTPPEACSLLRQGRFQVLQTDFLFLFPNMLKALRWIEPLVSRLPLAGQYQVLCRKS